MGQLNEKGSNIIPFPKPKVEQYDLETVHYVIENMVADLEDLGYDVKEEQLKRDIAVLANMLFASFARKHVYNKHVFHFVLDDQSNEYRNRQGQRWRWQHFKRCQLPYPNK